MTTTSTTESAPHLESTKFVLLAKNISESGGETIVESDSVQLGGVLWTAQVRISKQCYPNPNAALSANRMHVWFSYSVMITCTLPDDTNFYNCLAHIRYDRKWVSDMSEQSHLEENSEDSPKNFDRTTHRFTHEERRHVFRTLLDPGAEHRNESAMKFVITLGVIDALPPVCFTPPSFDANQPWNDLEIVFDDKNTLFTSRAILASCSPYFKALLYGNFKEKRLDSIAMPSVQRSEFEILLNHLHPCCRQPVADKNVETLLYLADRFLIESVMQECEKFLLYSKRPLERDTRTPNSGQNLSGRSLQNHLFLADLYRLTRLKQQCVHEISSQIEKCSLDNEQRETNGPNANETT